MRTLIFVLALLLPGVSAAQSGKLSGHVRSGSDSTAIAGAVVSIAGTSFRTTTTKRGLFVLRDLRGVAGDSVDLQIERAGARTVLARIARSAQDIAIFVHEPVIAVAAISVTGVRDARRDDSPQQTLALERADLEAFNELTLGDVLRRAPGLVVSGGPGETSELRMRGLGPEYTQVLVDGRRLPGASDRRDFQLDQLPAWLVERATIVRNGSARMSSQAVAGTVDITLRRIPATSSLDWGVGAGPTDVNDDAVGTNAALHYGGSSPRFGYVLSGAFQNRPSQIASERVSLDAGKSDARNTTDTNESASREMGFAPQLSVLLKSSALSFTPLLLDSRRNRSTVRTIATSVATLGEAEREQNERQVWRMQLGYTYAPGTTSLALVAGAQGSDADRDKTRTRYLPGGAPMLTEVERDVRRDREWFAGARLQLQAGASHDIAVGGDLTLRERAKRRTRVADVRGVALDRTGAADRYDVSEADAVAFVEGRFETGARTTVTTGLRAEATQNEAHSRDLLAATQRGTVWIPVLHVLHRAGSTNLRAAATRATRRAPFDYLVPYVQFMDGTLTRPDLIGNPGLRPETSAGVELSIEHFFGRKRSLGINALARRISNRIEMTVAADSVSGRMREQPVNAGDGFLYGLELDGETSIRSRSGALRLWSNLSLYRSHLTDAFTGERRMFSRQPEYLFNAGFDQSFRGLGLSAGGSFNRVPRSLRVETASAIRQSEYEDEGDVVNAYLAKRIGRQLLVRLAAHNVMQSERVRARTSTAADGSPVSTARSTTRTPRRFYLTLRSKAGGG